MQQSGMALSGMMRPSEVPAPVRFLGKLVLEVLPAAMASIIGAFLFAHYQFGEPTYSEPVAEPANTAGPASATMMQLVRDEHSIVRDYILAERTAEKARVAAVDAADARAADANLVATEARHAATAQSAGKPAARQSKLAITAAASTGGAAIATTQLPPVVIASARQDQTSVSPTAAPPASLISKTLSVPGHVVAATLHAVMAIGGIPSWIGRRVGRADLDIGAPVTSAAS